MAEIEVKIPQFRAWYVSVFEPRAVKGDTSGKMLYSVMACFAPGTDLTPLKVAAGKAAELLWHGNAAKTIAHPKFKPLLKEQATLLDANGDLLPGAELGGYYLSLSNKIQPLIVGPNGQPTLDPAIIYSGAYCLAIAGAFAWEHPTGGKGVSFSLKGIQQVADGEPLGGGSGRAKLGAFAPVAGAAVHDATGLFG
jgi:hypothetical protein